MLAPQNAPKKEDFSLKEIKPKITGKAANTSGPSTTFDLVEQMQYLYVKFEKVRGLPPACHPYIEVNIGNYKATTQHLENNNQVFAFKRDKLQSNKVDILVKDKAAVAGDGTIGKFDFAVNEAQMRILPNSPFASQWVRLKDEKELKGAELLLAYWMGAQADGAFNEPYYADTASVVSGYGVSETHPKMYDFYYKLWYLRVNVIQAEDLVFRDMNNGKPREIFVKASVGRWVLRTKASQTKTDNPMWNEDLMFVVAEKFEDDLIVSVEEKVDNMGGSFTLGSCKIPLANVAKRNNAAAATAVKYNLEMMEKLEGKVKFASKMQMRVSLDGGYHVLDEPAHSISDYRPSAKALWKPKIGTLIYTLIGALVYCVFVGIRSYPNRPKQIPHINTELSHLHTALPDVLDEELDPFPTRRTDVETLRRRYDRLRSIGLNIQTLLGDIATQGERVQSLLSWRDPRATSMFVISCVIAVFILSVVRFDAIVFLAGGYVLLPPIFRTRFPVYPQNLLRRMPAKTDIFV
ncbi:hypothetical protein DVH24_042047 [Malus domestica]|uniref:C2 domain-containing protein n=1 Tax=Malus domestica TaxID=3750 RepID=A0A498IQ16_MALDO|nr:hypothetical protein DVH24_042047 [Malus domestica]